MDSYLICDRILDFFFLLLKLYISVPSFSLFCWFIFQFISALIIYFYFSWYIYNIQCFVDLRTCIFSLWQYLCYMYLPKSTCRFKCQNFFFSIFTNVDVPIKNTYEYYCSIYKMIFCNLRYFCLKEVWNILRAIFV